MHHLLVNEHKKKFCAFQRTIARRAPGLFSAVSSGFNSDVNVGDDVFHVQTEDYGEPQYSIVTLVYHGGQILHRRNSNYSDIVDAPGYSEEALSERVENQHRSVIEEVRSGAISVPRDSARPNRSAQGIQVCLRNPNSWLANGQATLDVQVLKRADQSPIAGANVEAYLSGVKEVGRFNGETAADGVAQIRFAMPSVSSHGGELVIRADVGGSEAVDEIRFALRAKPKPRAPEAKP